jgi:DNA-directed RNA polymerase specialized sigma24 family protein
MADPRLSQIETLWSVVRQAHSDESAETSTAGAQLIERYSDAIQRYLMACLRDRDAVDEVFQEYALRFVRGDFSNVSADKRRFRSYIKTVIYHLVADFGRRRKKYAATALEHESMLAGDGGDEIQLDEQFQTIRRDSILGKGWDELKRNEEQSGKAWHTVLKARADNPQMRSPELAELVSNLVGKEVSAGNVRVLVHRARERFAEILMSLVKDSLSSADDETLEHELIDLNLWQYCKPLMGSTDDDE